MIELTELGVTFLGGGELNIDDLVNATKLAPKLIAADGAADVCGCVASMETPLDDVSVGLGTAMQNHNHGHPSWLPFPL